MTTASKRLQWMIIVFILGTCFAHAAIILTDDFSAGNDNWGDRDVGEMSVSHNGGFGNSAGSMEGVFAVQNPASPETDAFRLTTGLGDLTQGGTYNLTSFTFDFYAASVLPSDLIFRFGDGSSTFFQAVTLTGLNSWETFTLSLASVSGWFGGNQTQFDAALQGTTFVEVQVSRSGTNSQTYYMDNFTLNGDLAGGGGGGPSAIPEPNTISLLLLVALVVVAVRRHVILPESTT